MLCREAANPNFNGFFTSKEATLEASMSTFTQRRQSIFFKFTCTWPINPLCQVLLTHLCFTCNQIPMQVSIFGATCYSCLEYIRVSISIFTHSNFITTKTKISHVITDNKIWQKKFTIYLFLCYDRLNFKEKSSLKN